MSIPAKSLDTLFVQAAVFDDSFLRNRSVDGEYILFIDVDLA